MLNIFFFVLYFVVNIRRSGFYEYDPSHGVESDMTAEEIFNMFLVEDSQVKMCT